MVRLWRPFSIHPIFDLVTFRSLCFQDFGCGRVKSFAGYLREEKMTAMPNFLEPYTVGAASSAARPTPQIGVDLLHGRGRRCWAKRTICSL